MDAVRVCSLGQITSALFEVGGQYRRNIEVGALLANWILRPTALRVPCNFLEMNMANDVQTEQLVASLIMKATDDIAAGKTRAQVIQALVDMAASPAVAEAIALRAEDVHTGHTPASYPAKPLKEGVADASAPRTQMLSKIPLWLGRLSVGRKLTLIYLLDLTAVIYVSGILIHEKYLAIDFARKEIVGAHYAEVVRRNLMGAFRVPPPSAAPQTATTHFVDDLQALEAIRSAHDADLNTTEASLRLHKLLQTPQSKGNKTALLSQGRDLLTIVGNQSNLILDPDLDSYYVMSLTVLRFPELLQVLYDTRDFMQHWGQTSQ
eukprot:gene48-63_t